MGIIGTLELAAAVVLAAPLVSFGFSRALAGDPFGYAALAVAVLLVAIPTVLPDPLDPATYLENAADAVVEEPEE